ncbi:MAG: hypothetical protein Q8Q14_00045 [Gemmatimonadales bacterium]|nr:hypothetical protein [Gemmatimonadales bacterium]
MLIAGTDRSGRTLPLAGGLAAVSLGVMLMASGGDGGGASPNRLAGFTNAYIVLVTAAFLGVVLLKPAALLRQTVRAVAAGGAATALLVQLLWGADGWRALAWEATRDAGLAMRFVVERTPNAFNAYEPVVRFVSLMTPGMLVLQTFAGFALAWSWHQRLVTAPLGAPAARFREFRIADGWVWGLVVWLAIWIAPTTGILQVAGANMGFVLTTLYVLRGAAIVTVFAEAAGISATALIVAGSIATALALPLLLLLPGLCTLGITDTWYQYRRRLAARQPPIPPQSKAP